MAAATAAKKSTDYATSAMLPKSGSSVVQRIATLVRRIDCLRVAWDACSLDLLLTKFYDCSDLAVNQDSATVALIDALSQTDASWSLEKKCSTIVDALAARGIKPSASPLMKGVPLAAASGQQTAVDVNASTGSTASSSNSGSTQHHHHNTNSNRHSNSNHHYCEQSTRVRTMSDVTTSANLFEATHNSSHFTHLNLTAPTVRAAPQTSSGSDFGVPQLDLDELLSPISSKGAFGVREAIKSDLLSKVRQKFDGVARQRSRSEVDTQWLLNKGYSDIRPDWMTGPRFLKSLEKRIDGPSLFHVEWNILGLSRALRVKRLDRVVSPRFTLTPPPNCPPLSSLLMMIVFTTKANQIYYSLSISIPEKLEVKYRVFHSSYLSESRWHSFVQTPWATSELLPLSTPIPDVFNVGTIIEAVVAGSPTTAAADGTNSSSSSLTSSITTATTTRQHVVGTPPASGTTMRGSSSSYIYETPRIDSLPSLTELIDILGTTTTAAAATDHKPSTAPPAGGVLLPSSPSLETMLETFSSKHQPPTVLGEDDNDEDDNEEDEEDNLLRRRHHHCHPKGVNEAEEESRLFEVLQREVLLIREDDQEG